MMINGSITDSLIWIQQNTNWIKLSGYITENIKKRDKDNWYNLPLGNFFEVGDLGLLLLTNKQKKREMQEAKGGAWVRGGEEGGRGGGGAGSNGPSGLLCCSGNIIGLGSVGYEDGSQWLMFFNHIRLKLQSTTVAYAT